MKKYLGMLMAFAAACALCLGLVGCGGNSEQESTGPDLSAYLGQWDLTEMTVGEEATDSATLEQMRALGMSVYLELKQDMTAELNMFGEVAKGTWTVKADGQVDLTIEDAGTATCVIEGDKLTMTDDKSQLVFVRNTEVEEEAADASASASASGSASASASATADSSSAAASESTAASSSSAAADTASSSSSTADGTAMDDSVDEEDVTDEETADEETADDMAADEEAEE